MALFVTIETHDHTQVLIWAFLELFLLLVGFPGLSYVYSGGWGRAFLTFSVSSALFFFLLFSSFLGGLIGGLRT